MKYEYKMHAVYRGYGWIEPLTDSEDSLIEDHLARRICDELNTLQSECERLRKDVASLVEALEDVGASWHGEGYMRNVARRALAAYHKGSES